MKRKDLIPKLCNRCGNFLWGGYVLWYLPYEKKYISFCEICAKGLEISQYFVQVPMSEKKINDFWEEKLK